MPKKAAAKRSNSPPRSPRAPSPQLEFDPDMLEEYQTELQLAITERTKTDPKSPEFEQLVHKIKTLLQFIERITAEEEEEGPRRKNAIPRNASDSASESEEESDSEPDEEEEQKFDSEEEEEGPKDKPLTKAQQAKLNMTMALLKKEHDVQKTKNEKLALLMKFVESLQEQIQQRKKDLGTIYPRLKQSIPQLYTIVLRVLNDLNRSSDPVVKTLSDYFIVGMRIQLTRFIIEDKRESVDLEGDSEAKDEEQRVSLPQMIRESLDNPPWALLKVDGIHRYLKQYEAPQAQYQFAAHKKIQYVTLGECAYLAHMLLHTDEMQGWEQSYLKWPMFKTKFDLALANFQDYSWTSDLTSLDFMTLDRYLESIWSSKTYVEGVSAMQLRWTEQIPHLPRTEKVLLKLKEAKQSISPSIASQVPKNPALGTERFTSDIVVELFKQLEKKTTVRQEQLYMPRPGHFRSTKGIKEATVRQLEAYLDLCKRPYIAPTSDKILENTTEINVKTNALGFLDTIDYMYAILAELTIKYFQSTKKSCTEAQVNAKWEELTSYFSSQPLSGMKAYLDDKQKSHMDQIESISKNIIQLTLFPIESLSEKETPRLFSNGIQRRLFRLEQRRTPFSGEKAYNEPNPMIVLSPECEKMCYGIMVRKMNDQIPHAKYVHAYHFAFSTANRLFYQPTLFMKYLIGKVEAVIPNDLCISIDGHYYQLARYNLDKNLIEFTASDYTDIISLQPLSPVHPFYFLSFDHETSLSKRIVAERIYSIMERDMKDIPFQPIWRELLDKRLKYVTIDQVLHFFYLLVAVAHPAFQLNFKTEIFDAYTSGKALSLLRDHQEEQSIRRILREVLNISNQTNISKQVVQYTNDFVSALLASSFPLLKYKALHFPYFSSFITDAEIEEVRKIALPDDIVFGPLLRVQRPQAEIDDLFSTPVSSPIVVQMEDEFPDFFNESEQVTTEVNPIPVVPEVNPIPVVPVVNPIPVVNPPQVTIPVVNPPEVKPSTEENPPDKPPQDAVLGKKHKKCTHRGKSPIKTLRFPGPVEIMVCDKCHERV